MRVFRGPESHEHTKWCDEGQRDTDLMIYNLKKACLYACMVIHSPQQNVCTRESEISMWSARHPDPHSWTSLRGVLERCMMYSPGPAGWPRAVSSHLKPSMDAWLQQTSGKRYDISATKTKILSKRSQPDRFPFPLHDKTFL